MVTLNKTTKTYPLKTLADTKKIAQYLAKCPGISNAFVALEGDIGAGKTTFARYLLRALGVRSVIKSPTYAIALSYQAPVMTIWHYDFYRMEDTTEFEESGLRDSFGETGLKIAEWSLRLGSVLPAPDLTLQFFSDTNLRVITLTAGTHRGDDMLYFFESVCHGT